MGIAYDLFGDGALADPYPWYRWLRREAPCYYSAEHDIWIVSRYDDVVDVLRNVEVFSSTLGVGYERRHTRDLVSADPPEHTRLRRLVNRQFLPRAVAALEPRVATIIDELFDAVVDKRVSDLITDVAEPLPITVIAELLGVAPERRSDFKRWSDDLVDIAGGHVSGDDAARLAASRKELAQFFREAAAERRSHPRADATDIITSLVQASDDDRLSEAELVEFCMVLLVAGNETTTNAVGNGALAMLCQPDQWGAVVDDPSLTPSFVEEVLRFDAPIQGFFRNTLAPTVVAGTPIPADARVLALFGSANRDDHHYPDADTFLATRNPTDHVAFGNGIHHCLGAPLARLELRILADVARRRIRSMLPAGEVLRTRNPLFRGVRHLPVFVEAK